MPDREDKRGLMGSLQDAWRWIAGAGPGGLEGNLAPLAPLAGRQFTMDELASILGPLDYEIAVAMQPAGEGVYELARAYSQGDPARAWIPPIGLDWSEHELVHNHPPEGLPGFAISSGDVRTLAGRGTPQGHVVDEGGTWMSFDGEAIEQMIEALRSGEPMYSSRGVKVK